VARRSPSFVLASDLDGTLIHGDPAVRARLVQWLRAQPDAALIYVTGRSPESVAEIAVRMALPAPDILIADVGTSVLHGLGPNRIAEIEAELGRRWPGREVVRQRLQAMADLTLQGVRSPRRVSYWIEPVRRLRADAADPFAAAGPQDRSMTADSAAAAAAVAARAARKLADLDVDVLLSGNVFLDVLPRGVDKGTTLGKVLDWLGAPRSGCVVAGDSFNDLALFEVGYRGIVVGNCEPALRQRLAGARHIYQAREEGVAGVVEGLRHHGFDPDTPGKGGPNGE
jgi:HAD superfamily hydrolase (TIGR01484 family)